MTTLAAPCSAFTSRATSSREVVLHRSGCRARWRCWPTSVGSMPRMRWPPFWKLPDQRAVVRADVDDQIVFGQAEHLRRLSAYSSAKLSRRMLGHAAGVGIFRREEDGRIDHQAELHQLAGFEGDVLVTYADCPLLTPPDLEPLFALRARGRRPGGAGLRAGRPRCLWPADPGADGAGQPHRRGQGREPGRAGGHAPATPACCCADTAALFGWLDRVGNDNAKGEYYLTDVVGLAGADGQAGRAPPSRRRARSWAATRPGSWPQAEAHLPGPPPRRSSWPTGVAMLAPETVHFSWDTEIAAGRDGRAVRGLRARRHASRPAR